MTYFKTKDIAAITIFAALWGVLNPTISPVFFQVFHLPFLCDLIGFATLILTSWFVRKVGTATLTGIIATILNLTIRPDLTNFFGFTAASVIFDIFAYLIGYKLLFGKRFLGSFCLFATSVFSAAAAGLIIGSFFMDPIILQRGGGIFIWMGLHAVGGVLGGALGVTLMNALALRGIQHAQN
jgi:uncharacterized membrane protein YvlD (DUF360 family)